MDYFCRKNKYPLIDWFLLQECRQSIFHLGFSSKVNQPTPVIIWLLLITCIQTRLVCQICFDSHSSGNVKRKGLMWMLVMLRRQTYFCFTFHHLVLSPVFKQRLSTCTLSATSTNIYFDLIIKYILIWSSNTFWFDQQTCYPLAGPHIRRLSPLAPHSAT